MAQCLVDEAVWAGTSTTNGATIRSDFAQAHPAGWCIRSSHLRNPSARVLSYQIVDLVKVRSVVQLSIQSDAQFASESFPRSTITTLELSQTRSKTISAPSGETSKSPMTKLAGRSVSWRSVPVCGLNSQK